MHALDPRPAPAGTTQEHPLIAIVDDDLEIRTMLHELLTWEGYRTALAATTAEAMQVLQQVTPDLLITDWWLETPNGGGCVLDMVEQGPATQNMPVLVCSGHFQAWQLKALELQRRGYVVMEKPFVVAELLAKIQALIGVAHGPGVGAVTKPGGRP